MDEKQLAVGDVVVLASGGPDMTVVDLGPDSDQVGCRWFDGELREYMALFPVASLRLAEGGPSPSDVRISAEIMAEVMARGLPQRQPDEAARDALGPSYTSRSFWNRQVVIGLVIGAIVGASIGALAGWFMESL